MNELTTSRNKRVACQKCNTAPLVLVPAMTVRVRTFNADGEAVTSSKVIAPAYITCRFCFADFPA